MTLTFNFGEPFDSVRLDVEVEGELEIIVELDGTVSFPIVIESLQLDDEHRRQLLDTHSLNCVHLLATLLAQVGVVALQ